MDTNVFAGGFVLFAIVLVVHVCIWRVRIPANDAGVLIMIFLVVPVAAAFAVIVIKYLQAPVPVTYGDIIGIILLHMSLSLVYVSSYPAVQAVSPSLDILLMIGKSEEGKMTEEDIVEQYRGSKIVTDRVGDLRIYNLIYEKDGFFTLKPVAMLIVLFFIFYRKLLGLPVGEG